MRFVQKYIQDMSNSTRANMRTLPECASIKVKKKFIYLRVVIACDCKT